MGKIIFFVFITIKTLIFFIFFLIKQLYGYSIVYLTMRFILSILICLLNLYLVNGQGISRNNQQVKLGFTSLFKGDFLFGYERLFSKKVSGEIDFGILTRDYAENFFYEISTAEEKTSLPGYSLAAGIRYYPISSMDLLFVTGEIKYRNYRYSSSEIVAPDTKENEQRVTPRLGIGYIFHIDENFNFDMSGNLGFTFKRSSIDQQGELNGPSPNKFHFGLNIKFSYSF